MLNFQLRSSSTNDLHRSNYRFRVSIWCKYHGLSKLVYISYSYRNILSSGKQKRIFSSLSYGSSLNAATLWIEINIFWKKSGQGVNKSHEEIRLSVSLRTSASFEEKSYFNKTLQPIFFATCNTCTVRTARVRSKLAQRAQLWYPTTESPITGYFPWNVS